MTDRALSPAESRELFSRMLLIRRFEEALVQVGPETPGWYHTGIGQEGNAVVAAAVLRPQDYSNTSHRNHAHALARGVSPRALMAEIFGKATGVNRGFGGSMHTVSVEHGIMLNSAMVGGSVPAVVGMALASKLRGDDRVNMAWFGDGAVTEGAVYESLCLASLWKVPVVFACENDRGGEMTFERATGSLPFRNVTDIPSAFDMPVRTVDGSDIATLHRMLRAAVERTRSTGGPSFIEIQTRAWPGRATDPIELPGGPTDLDLLAGARSSEPTDTVWSCTRDPLGVFLRELFAAGALDMPGAKAIDAHAVEKVRDAVEFAYESKWPEPGSVFPFSS
jgi:pyruvate dehydrogenase E1 component alpha subunit